MTSQIFYLQERKTSFIRVDSEDNWTKTIVYKNNEKLGEIHGKENLITGRSFQTPEGEIVFINLKRPLFRQEKIKILINGNPHYHKERPNTPQDKIKRVRIDILFIALASLIFGFLSIVLNNSEISRINFGYQSIIFGIIYSGLGIIYHKFHSLTILYLLLIFLILDTLLLFSFKFDLANVIKLHIGLITRAYSLYLTITVLVIYRHNMKLIYNVR